MSTDFINRIVTKRILVFSVYITHSLRPPWDLNYCLPHAVLFSSPCSSNWIVPLWIPRLHPPSAPWAWRWLAVRGCACLSNTYLKLDCTPLNSTPSSSISAMSIAFACRVGLRLFCKYFLAIGITNGFERRMLIDIVHHVHYILSIEIKPNFSTLCLHFAALLLCFVHLTRQRGYVAGKDKISKSNHTYFSWLSWCYGKA